MDDIYFDNLQKLFDTLADNHKKLHDMIATQYQQLNDMLDDIRCKLMLEDELMKQQREIRRNKYPKKI